MSFLNTGPERAETSDHRQKPPKQEQNSFPYFISGFFPSQQWEDEHPDIPFELVPLSLYWSNQPSSFNLVGRQS